MNGPHLVIDAATWQGTAAVIDGSRVLAQGEAAMRGVHEERLMPLVARTLEEARVAVPALAGIVAGAGPGSFTSLRIAASIAKGLATAAGCPMLAVPSLLLLVAGVEPPVSAGRYLAVLDAMRGECFAARVSVAPGGVATLDADLGIIPRDEVERIAAADHLTTIGPALSINVLPHARGAARATTGPGGIVAVDMTRWEPSYGRLAEAQVRWEREHGRRLDA